jgi:hypothetical protein
MPSSRRKRPCCFCRKWYRPDPRIGDRQRACRSRECQRRRRQQSQGRWRQAHPDYDIARHIHERNQGERTAEPLRVAAPLNRLPWDIAQDEMGSKAADFVGYFGKIMQRHVQDVMQAQVRDFANESDTHAPSG